MIKIIEIISYGDFDMPHTKSVWYKELYSGEATTQKEKNFHDNMSDYFKYITGFMMVKNADRNFSVHESIAEKLYIFLKKEGFKKAETTKITLSDYCEDEGDD